MTQFAIISILLIIVAGAFVLPPLWLGSRSSREKSDRKQANLAIFRDQLAELESEKLEGTLAEGDFEQAKRELQRRLLEEVEPATAAAGESADYGPSRKTALAVLLLMPILALLAYGTLGNLRALDPAQRVAQEQPQQPQITPERIKAMVAQLAEKLKANPDDMKGWLMLARSYSTLGEYDKAVAAYGKAENVINDDPDLLAAYAETMAMAQGRSFKGKPRQMLDRALKLDPKHGTALFLSGAAAMEAGERDQAIGYWEALLPQVEPGSGIDKMLRSGIEKMKQAKAGPAK